MDRQCRESEGKAKIKGYMSVSDEEAHQRKHGRGYQYLVRWVGFGPADDEWLLRKDVEDCEALDWWIEANSDWPAAEQ